MRIATLLSALCAVRAVIAQQRTAQVYIQPLSSTSKPQPLAEISYDPAALASSSIVSYDAPEFDDDGSDSSSSLVRIGLYDTKSSSWVSGTTVASSENFGKGYAPNLLLSVDARGEVLSAAVKGVRIDAGQTRDFGPKAVVLVETKGKQPDLNKPVVLSPEGKKVEEEEKTFLQKYGHTLWMSDHRDSRMPMLTFTQVLVDAGYWSCPNARRRCRRRQIIDHRRPYTYYEINNRGPFLPVLLKFSNKSKAVASIRLACQHPKFMTSPPRPFYRSNWTA